MTDPLPQDCLGKQIALYTAGYYYYKTATISNSILYRAKKTGLFHIV